MIIRGPRGPAYSAGHPAADGHVVLVRDDASTTDTNVRLLTGNVSVTDNGDGTCTLTVS